MRRLLLLPLLTLAACGAGSDTSTPSDPDAGYATQMIAPSPDYRAIIANAPLLEPFEGRRESTAPLPDDAGTIGAQWLARLEAIDVVDGYGLAGKNDDSPIGGFDLRMTAGEFDAWVAENGWVVPPHLRWSFVPPMGSSRVTDAAADAIRIWPASEQRTGLQLQAAAGGRIYLEDGCFYVQRRGQQDAELAWFHTETGLDVDEEGYFVLVNRVSGQVEGRLGEEFTWSAPNPITPGGPSMEEFRAACGDAPVHGVGNPTADAKMNTIYPQSAPDAMPPPGIE